MGNTYKKVEVNTREKAWEEVGRIFPLTEKHIKDEIASINAGCPIYTYPSFGQYNRVCDFGDRLEVFSGEYGENITNIRIEPEFVEGMGTNMSEADYQRLFGNTKEWEIGESDAILLVNSIFAFEASSIVLVCPVQTFKKNGPFAEVYRTYIRNPQFRTADCNYVRFDVGAREYEMVNGSLKIYNPT